jgi:hypothetical protein
MLLLLILFVVACGKKQVTTNDDFVTYNSVSFSPLIPSYSDVDCMNVDINEYRRLKLSFFVDLKNLFVFSDFSTLIDHKGRLQNPFSISETIFNYKETSYYQAYYNKQNEQWDIDKDSLYTIEGSHRAVKICSNKSYDSYSVENAALNSDFVIDRTFQQVIHSTIDLYLPRVSISITPLYAVRIEGNTPSGEVTSTQYQTDNAFYSSLENRITFLPQSKEGQEQNLFGGKALWDIPMVASHEYGHHIFHQLFPEASEGKTSLCFDNRVIKGKLIDKRENYFVREVGPQAVFGAINEGFADLIAYYALGDELFSLQGITCMEDNREVDKSYFSDGSKKDLSYKNVNNFFSRYRMNSAQTCFVPNYQDIHIMGAAIASLIYRQLSSLSIHGQQGLNIILRWIQNVRSDYLSDRTREPEEVFSRSIVLFTQTLFSIVGEDKKVMICDLLNTTYPESKYGVSSTVNPCGPRWW